MRGQMQRLQGAFELLAAQSAMAEAERKEALADRAESQAELREVDARMGRVLQHNVQLQQRNEEDTATARTLKAALRTAEAPVFSSPCLVPNQVEVVWPMNSEPPSFVLAK